jgi:hypothetical protein
LEEDSSVEVKCYSGFAYAERPVSFRWRGKEYNIEKIEKEWQEPGRKCFLVSTGETKSFQLCYNHINQQWTLAGKGRCRKNERDSKDT